MRVSTLLVRGVICAALPVVAGCTTQDTSASDSAAPAGAAAAEPRVITISAADYSFEAPDTVAAGLTTIRLLNGGNEMHHVQLLRFADGHTFDEFMNAMKASKEPAMPAWVIATGGPNSPGPTGEAEATLDLAPGNYAIICVIPSPDGMPHAAKGMARPLIVTPAGTASIAAAPKADIVMKLVDYGFEMPETITAGRHTIRVENAAAQPHEVFIVQLAPGKTAQDLIAYVSRMTGPPPGRPVGGTTFMGKGGVNYITVDLPAGEYGLFCFVPDAKDGKPHIAHGMVRQFTIGS